MIEKIHFRRHLSSFQIIILSFAGVILFGALILMLPISSAAGIVTPFHSAIFTSTSAVCVTGLVVLDTGSYWSPLGQAVILLLIQIGGLGVVTAAVSFAMLAGRKISLMQRSTMQDAISAPRLGGIVRLTRFVLKGTLLIELIGALCMLPSFCGEYGASGIWKAVFHSVSAFCNAGFDLFGDYASLTGHYNDITLNLCIMALITIGGIGFTVLDDLRRNRKWKKLRLHSKIVLTASAILTFGGTLVILALEYTNPATLGGMPNELDKWMAAAFQAVTCRTAGFNTIDLTDMRASSLFFMVLLMGIGASPTSTGGGMKTTTVLVLLVSTWGLLHGKRDTVLFDRRIASETVDKAYNVFTVCLLWMLGAYFLLLICDGGLHRADYVLFEVVSAFATVGLGVGITPDWNDWGKLILVLTMYAGRIGVLTFVLSFLHSKDDKIRYPSENIMIG